MSSTFAVFNDTGEIICQTICYCADCKTQLRFAGPRTKQTVNRAGEPINHGRPTISDCGFVLTTPIEAPDQEPPPSPPPQSSEKSGETKGKVIEFRPRSKK